MVVNEPLPSEYLAQAEATLKNQISYGGYRLGALLQSIYGAKRDIGQAKF